MDKNIAGTLVGAVVVIAVLVFGASMYTATPPTTTPVPPGPGVTMPPIGPITIEGTIVCLPHKNPGEVQTMECAYGLRNSAGTYFALSDTDPMYRNISSTPMNTPVKVEGTFALRATSNYQDIGVISVTKITQLGGSGTPTTTNPQTITLGINKTASALGVTLTPREVLEDSRCPIDVVCIQAGTVRVRATLQSASGTADQIFELGKTITTEAESITLKSVEPGPRSTVPITAGTYLFYFEIAKR